MKKIFLGSIMILSMSAYAGYCADRTQDPNWPEDKNEMVLDCVLTNVEVGNVVEDRICFVMKKTQYSKYKTTVFHTMRFQSNRPGKISTLVSMNQNGEALEGGEISKKGTVYTISEEKNSYDHDQRWVESTIVDIENPRILTFNIYNKKFFSSKLKNSATYTCIRE